MCLSPHHEQLYAANMTLFIIIKAGGDPQSCQQVSQMFDCFPDFLILTMFVF